MGEKLQERAAFAEWLARQHLRFDSRMTEVVYLPAGSPDEEVRLLEVNTGLYSEPGSPIVPVQTTPTNAGLPFRVVVADVTPDEWDRIRADPAMLPAGWSLDDLHSTRRAG